MATTNIKFEYSPAESLAESFASSPGQMYSPLFDDDSSMNPMDVMTPKSFDEDSILDNSTDGLVNLTDLVSPKGPDSEKKPIKKRKSWGQQLPEPKTNLPPRKRAKTEDEKEQRRVERVLRNRRAAQSSRERKRLEVEALEAQKLAAERRNADLELQLAEMQARNALLMSELERIGGSNNMAIFRGSSVSSSPRQAEPVRSTPAPITFSQDLFGSHEETNQPTTLATSSSLPQTPVQTVDPASLSPEIKPVAESDSNASSSDLTQHPAAVLCDLQCQSVEQRPWMDSSSTASTAISTLLTTLMMTSAAISAVLSPLSQIMISLKTGSSLSPTNSLLTSIIWLTTTTMSLTASTSTISSTMMTSPTRKPRFTLRINLLRRLLTCSPCLARPLMDATVEAMRSASEQSSQLLAASFSSLVGTDRSHHSRKNEPSLEVLATLLWATQCIIRDIEQEKYIEQQKQEKQQLSQPERDAATEAKLACEELDAMFRPRIFKSVLKGTGSDGWESLSPISSSQKSLDAWRTAFRH